jgi:uncharacterized protein YjiK
MTTCPDVRRRVAAVAVACALAACGTGTAGTGADAAEPADPVPAGSATPGRVDASELATAFAPERLVQWALPRSLREISALARTGSGRVFAVADEELEVHELDVVEGRRIGRFDVGSPRESGDFEGLAAVGDELWAVTSDGELYAFPIGEDRSAVPFRRYDTELGRVCELEGLAALGPGPTLLLACKSVRLDAFRGDVLLVEWRGGNEAGSGTRLLRIAEAELAAAVGTSGFHPSAVAVHPTTGDLWLLAARERAVARLRRDGTDRLRLLEASRLPAADRHRQPEGMLLLPDGTVLIADEGGDGRARLGRYGTQ